MRKGNLARLLRPLDPIDVAYQTKARLSTVYRWQNGETVPHRKWIPILALVLGLRPENVEEVWLVDRKARARRRV